MTNFDVGYVLAVPSEFLMHESKVLTEVNSAASPLGAPPTPIIGNQGLSAVNEVNEVKMEMDCLLPCLWLSDTDNGNWENYLGSNCGSLGCERHVIGGWLGFWSLFVSVPHHHFVFSLHVIPPSAVSFSSPSLGIITGTTQVAGDCWDTCSVTVYTRPKVKAMSTHCLSRYKGEPLYLTRQCAHVAFAFGLVIAPKNRNIVDVPAGGYCGTPLAWHHDTDQGIKKFLNLVLLIVRSGRRKQYLESSTVVQVTGKSSQCIMNTRAICPKCAGGTDDPRIGAGRHPSGTLSPATSSKKARNQGAIDNITDTKIMRRPGRSPGLNALCDQNISRCVGPPTGAAGKAKIYTKSLVHVEPSSAINVNRANSRCGAYIGEAVTAGLSSSCC
ncbi:hypothetical protein VP01_5196g1 [Puccinia sorghi]|uniref:Uncharacterized protein n=1 Tax=Puccinia sorghi TaxID=27349 RepID=A0A0L6UKR6_9BASI|nr:hypothetical protein VP01_5196g1 [Puccinia sorghi]